MDELNDNYDNAAEQSVSTVLQNIPRLWAL